MHLRKSVKPPDRYEEEDNSKYNTRNSTKPRFPTLLAQQVVPFDAGNRPAVFPSLDLRQPLESQKISFEPLTETDKLAVVGFGGLHNQDQFIRTDLDSPEDRSSSLPFWAGQQGRDMEDSRRIVGFDSLEKSLDNNLNISDDEEVDDNVDWRDLEPGLQYQIFTNLCQNNLSEIVREMLKLTPAEYTTIKADIKKRSSHPATVEEIWSYASRSSDDIPGFIPHEMFELFIDYLKFASHFEFVHEAQISLAKKLLAYHDLDQGHVGEWVPDCAGSGFYMLVHPSAGKIAQGTVGDSDDQNNSPDYKDQSPQRTILPSRSKNTEKGPTASENAVCQGQQPHQTHFRVSRAPKATASIQIRGRKRPQKLVLDVRPPSRLKIQGDLEKPLKKLPVSQLLSRVAVGNYQLGDQSMLPTPPATGIPSLNTPTSRYHQPLAYSIGTSSTHTAFLASKNLCVASGQVSPEVRLLNKQDEVSNNESRSSTAKKENSDVDIEPKAIERTHSSSPNSDSSSLTLSIDKTTGVAEVIRSPKSATYGQQEAPTNHSETLKSQSDCKAQDTTGETIAPSLSPDVLHAADNPSAFSTIFCSAKFPAGEKFMLLSKSPEKRSSAEKWLIYGEKALMFERDVKSSVAMNCLEADTQWPTVLKDLVTGWNRWQKLAHGQGCSKGNGFEQIGLTILGFHDELRYRNASFECRTANLKERQLEEAHMKHQNQLQKILVNFKSKMRHLLEPSLAKPPPTPKRAEEATNGLKFDSQKSVLQYLARKRKASQIYHVSDEEKNNNDPGADFPTSPFKKLAIDSVTRVPLALTIPPAVLRSTTPEAPMMSPITPPFSPISEDESMMDFQLDSTMTTSSREEAKMAKSTGKRVASTARNHRSGRISGKSLRVSSRQKAPRKIL